MGLQLVYVFEGGLGGGRPDQGLPSLPGIPGHPDNSLPGGGVSVQPPIYLPPDGGEPVPLPPISLPPTIWPKPPRPVDPGYGRPEGGRPDQGLPGEQPGIDNTLPGGAAKTGGIILIWIPGHGYVAYRLPGGRVDNTLPETPEPK